MTNMSNTYTYWQDPADGLFVGYWNEFPDYMTQGRSRDELELMLRDIASLIRSGDLASPADRRQQGVLEFA